MLVRMLPIARQAYAGLLMLAAFGCGAPGEEHEDARRSAYANYNEGLAAFASKDYATAEAKLTAAIEARGLNPDVKCDAVVKRAICWVKSGKYNEALADLDSLGAGASNMDQIHAARSYIYKKQGKAAESRTELIKAKRLNPAVQEFKD